MDKQTLSGYGWIVIVTLVLAVMLALATPFGTYMGDGLVSTARAIVGANNNTMNEDNINSMSDKWTNKLGDPKDAGKIFFESGQPGLYDENNEMVASWDELINTYGLDIKTDYTVRKFYETYGSMYYVLNNNDILQKGTKLIIAENISSVGNYALADCYNLKYVSALGINKIGKGSFSYCTNLEVIDLQPIYFSTIEANAFEGCSNLKHITIPTSVKKISNYAFLDCTNLKSITLPRLIDTIGESAFENCTSLTTINYRGVIAEWNAINIGENNDCLVNANIIYNYTE